MEETQPPGPQDEAVHTLEHVDQYLQIGQESDASDIHLGVNAQPIWRRFGQLESIWLQADVLLAADTERLAMGFLNDHQKELLRDRGDVDFAYATPTLAAFARASSGIDSASIIVFRIINSEPAERWTNSACPRSLKTAHPISQRPRARDRVGRLGKIDDARRARR